MNKFSEDFGALVAQHMAEIFAGNCLLTLEEIESYREDATACQILGGLYFLNEELQARERARDEAMKETQAALVRIREQHEELLLSRALADELSTPIMLVGDGILLLPIIGTLDDARATLIMERMLDAVKSNRARYVILDITGVPSVDEKSGRYLRRFTQSIRFIGARTVLAGVTPQVAEALAEQQIDGMEIQSVRDVQSALRLCTASAARAAALPLTRSTGRL